MKRLAAEIYRTGTKAGTKTRKCRHAIGVTPGTPGIEKHVSELIKKNGTIVQWFENRGFGFIQSTSGKNYFFHITEWSDDIDQPPKIGQKISFESVVVEKGAKAVNVSPSSFAEGLAALAAPQSNGGAE